MAWRKAIGILAICATFLPVAARLSGGEEIVDQEYGFALVLPDGFQRDPRLVDADPDIIHAFLLGNPDDAEPDLVLVVQKLPGLIPPERIRPEEVPPGFQGRIFSMTWKGREVDAFEVPGQLAGIATLTYNVQIPLRRTGIQLGLTGPANRKSEMNRLLPDIVAGLDGESNWSGTRRPGGPDRSLFWMVLAVAIVIFFGGLVGLYLISKKLPKGMILAFAAMIFVGSFGVREQRAPEFGLIIAAFRMLGIAGGILGLIDLVSRRKPRQERATNAPDTDDERPPIALHGGDANGNKSDPPCDTTDGSPRDGS